MHECARIAWLKERDADSGDSGGATIEQKDSANEMNAGQFLHEIAAGNWMGPPPFRAEDVMRMNEEMKRGGH